MSDREFVESETKQLSILEEEKKSIEITLQAYEKSISAKVDAKSETQLTYYRGEIARAEAKCKEDIARAEAKFEEYRRYCNTQISILTGKGHPDPETGFVYDLKQLGDLIKKEIIDQVDHKNLNLDVPFMKDKLASCEVLVMEFWNILAPKITSTSTTAILHKIHLIETNKNSVEYFGE